MTFPKLTPPPPAQDALLDRWLNLLWRTITADGRLGWSQVDKAGSNLTDLETANHNDLGNLQGGVTASAFEESAFESSAFQIFGLTTSEYYHLTEAEHSELQRDGILTITVDTALDDTSRTAVVTVTAKTITLPAASTARIGKEWTIVLGVAGYCDIAAAGSDTLTLPTNDTIIRLNDKGSSVSLRCITATSWSLV